MSAPESADPAGIPDQNEDSDRRSFLSLSAMTLGLTSGYGVFAGMAARFLYPAKPPLRQWMYLSSVSELEAGQGLLFSAPNGQAISVTRVADEGRVEDFIALSSICPHLGCKVHWEVQNERFFCPCHNGAFNAEGEAVAGPPLDSRQNLARFPLKIENGILFIEVPVG